MACHSFAALCALALLTAGIATFAAVTDDDPPWMPMAQLNQGGQRW